MEAPVPLSGSHFKDAISRYQQRDPELYEELKKKFAAPRVEALDEGRRKAGITEEAPLVTDRGLPTPHGQMVLETIVRPNGRPVMIIHDNRATTRFLGPESAVWAKRIETAQPLLDRVIPSVGRVELKNNPDFQWVGTGWMVSPDIVVTNRHVAQEFARLGPQGFIFRPGLNGSPQSSRIDFLEEFQRAASLEFDIDSIVWIADASNPDVAFLRARRPAGGRPLPPPIQLAETVAVDDFVAAIGYPARDPRVPDQDLVRRIFGDVYEKKRLAPGQIIALDGSELEHDCSTLGGNSGSAIVNLATGDAVGLHFSGVFMQANYAVPASKVQELLGKAQRGQLPGMSPASVSTEPAVSPLAAAPAITTFQFQIPIEVSVKVGSPQSTAGATTPPTITITAPVAGAPDAIEAAVAAARQSLASVPDIVDIRPGYRFKNGWITDERVVVVEVREKKPLSELRAAGQPPIPPQFMGVGTDVRTAALADQLASLGIDLETLEAPAKAGLYREPPDLSLDPVKAKMAAIFHVSPDSGFPNLKAFLGRVKKHLTATIYEWEPTHISDAIQAAMKGAGHTLKMVTQPHIGIAEGTEDAVKDMQKRIGSKFQHVFASVGSGKLIPSAYHIKVASRDGEEFWLSSGNWKDSNQADIDPAGTNSHSITPLRQHNREWHAIVANPTLATLFQKYIDFDFEEAQRVPFEEMPMAALPEVFVPEEAFLAAEVPVAVTYFKPLKLNRELEIQPLLTPDRNSRHQHIFIKFATQLAQDAKHKIYVENQSFSISEGQAEYEDFFTTLRDQQKAGLDVRIIFRDPREFRHGDVTLQKTLEKIKEFDLDTDLVKVQKKCHTKGIIADAKQVILGSQNLTSAGSLFNRDASLLVRDPEVAAYFEKIFLFDWDHLAVQEANEVVGGVRLARPEEPTPAGFRRVSLAQLIGRD